MNGARTVFAFTREGLVVLDPATGAVRGHERWRSRQQASVNAATPLVVGDQVFVSACHGTGAALWRVRPGGLEVVWKDAEACAAITTPPWSARASCTAATAARRSEHRSGAWNGRPGRCGGARRVRLCGDRRRGRAALALTEHGELVAFTATPAAYREESAARCWTVLVRPVRAGRRSGLARGNKARVL